MSTQQQEFPQDKFLEFLLKATLYQKFYTTLPDVLPYDMSDLLPRKIYYDCGRCERNQAFFNKDSRFLDTTREELAKEIQENSARFIVAAHIGGREAIVNFTNSRAVGFYLLHYQCGICHETQLRWVLEVAGDERGPFIRKVGQHPPYDISISREMEKKLSSNDIELYKHAQICISQSYGIGACIYLRRLVEDQINPLLENYLTKRQEEGSDDSEIQQIREIMNERIMESKIKLVTKPHATTGINPVGKMYDKLSHGIHNLNDDDCTNIAQEVLAVFDEILVGLKKRMDEEAAYKERMKALEKPAGRQESESN